MDAEFKTVDFTDSVTFDRLNKLTPSTVFIEGLVYDWAERHPYIGGGYASPRAGKSTDYASVLAEPLPSPKQKPDVLQASGKTNNSATGIRPVLFFAGEATNALAGATAHAALETGVRAAAEVAASFT